MNRQGSLESLKTSMKAHRADFIRALAMERSQACIMYLLFTFRLRRIWCCEFCLGNFLLSKNITLYSCEWSSKLLWSPWRRRRATKLQAPHWSSHQERTPKDLQIWWCLSWGMSGPNLFVNRKCNVFPRCFVMLQYHFLFQQPPVTPKDPRSRRTRIWTQIKADLPVPSFKVFW